MPKLFGKEPKVWMPWALGIGGVLLVLLYLRSRSSGGSSVAPTGGEPSFGAGAYAPSGAATNQANTPGQDTASSFDLQLQDLLVKERVAGLANAQKMFDLQFGQASTLGGLYLGEAQQAAGQLTTARQHTKVECGKGESMYTDVNGNLACKGSGSSGFKSITNQIGSGIQDVVGGFIGGFAAVAPAAGSYYGKQAFGVPSTPKVGTPGIAPPNAKPGQAGTQYGGVGVNYFPQGFFNP